MCEGFLIYVHDRRSLYFLREIESKVAEKNHGPVIVLVVEDT